MTQLASVVLILTALGATGKPSLDLVLGCGLRPRPEALACVDGVLNTPRPTPERKAAEELKRLLKTDTIFAGTTEYGPAILYHPPLELTSFSGKRIRGGPYLFKLSVSPNARILRVKRLSPKSGLRDLDEYLERLARSCIVLPKKVGAGYVASSVIWNVNIDVH